MKTTRDCMILAMAIFTTANVEAVTYMGSLSAVNGGLVATGSWESSAVLSWTVMNNVAGNCWSYSYTFTVSEKAISHMIIEASPTFGADNLLSLDNAFVETELGIFTQNNSNTGMPASLFGIKFDTLDDPQLNSCLYKQPRSSVGRLLCS